jgi:galactokinase
LTKTVQTSAPGRVNLIGEHTDYNGGFVLPTAISQQTVIRLTPRNDLQVHGKSLDVAAEEATFSYILGQEKPLETWSDYVQGVTHALKSQPALFAKLRGFDLEVSSNVPLGSGLSSSAALEVALLRALREAFALDLSDTLIAQLGQRAENEFVGARVGIMDQMASSLADLGTALFLDTRSLEYRRVSLPKDSELVVINSGISHRHAGGGYNERRSECEAACAQLGIKELRDLNVADIETSLFQALPDVLRRRAKHVITENDRVLRCVKAMEAGDAKEMGRLFKDSHLSMRDDYAVSIPEIDQLVEIANRTNHVFGARLTGGGFGGSIVILVSRGQAEAVALQVAREYDAATGEKASILVPEIKK